MEDAISGVEIAAAPCLLALAVISLPLCLHVGWGQYEASLALLWYSVNPLFCEQARLYLRLELFRGKFFFLSFSFFFPSLWVYLSLGCYLTLVLSDCP